MTVDTKPLGELCEVLGGRNRVAREEADADRDFRVVRAEDIGRNLTSWQDLPPSTLRKKSSVEVLPGDIIGSVSGPHGRWAMVPPDYGASLASDHTVVLRKRPDVSAWYLLSFLRSEQGKTLLATTLAGSVIRRIAVAELRKLPVPQCSLSSAYLDQTLAAFDHELQRLGTEVDELTGWLDHVFARESTVQLIAEVDSLRDVTASLREITDLRDILRIGRSSFPYPIARALRAIERTNSSSERYHEVVHRSLVS